MRSARCARSATTCRGRGMRRHLFDLVASRVVDDRAGLRRSSPSPAGAGIALHVYVVVIGALLLLGLVAEATGEAPPLGFRRGARRGGASRDRAGGAGAPRARGDALDGDGARPALAAAAEPARDRVVAPRARGPRARPRDARPLVGAAAARPRAAGRPLLTGHLRARAARAHRRSGDNVDHGARRRRTARQTASSTRSRGR